MERRKKKLFSNGSELQAWQRWEVNATPVLDRKLNCGIKTIENVHLYHKCYDYGVIVIRPWKNQDAKIGVSELWLTATSPLCNLFIIRLFIIQSQ